MKKVHLIAGSSSHDFYYAVEVDNELEALQQRIAELEEERDEWKDAYFKLEFDETTGGCLLGCGGDSIEGHNTDECLFILSMPEPKAALSGAEAKHE